MIVESASRKAIHFAAISGGRSGMTIATSGIEADFVTPAAAGPRTFVRDLHPDLRAA